MKKMILIVMLLIGAISPVYADGDSTANPPVNIHFRRLPKGTTVGQPQKPAFCPIYGDLVNNELLIYSKVVGEAIISVIVDGGVVSSAVAELSGGFSLALPAVYNNVNITVVLNGITYEAVI